MSLGRADLLERVGRLLGRGAVRASFWNVPQKLGLVGVRRSRRQSAADEESDEPQAAVAAPRSDEQRGRGQRPSWSNIWRSSHRWCRPTVPVRPSGTSHRGSPGPRGSRTATAAAAPAARAAAAAGSPRARISRDPERREVRRLPLGVDQPVPAVVEQRRPARPARPSRRRSRGGTSTPRRTGRRSRQPYSPPTSRPSRQVSTECTQPRSCSRRYAVRICVVDPAGRPATGPRTRRSPRAQAVSTRISKRRTDLPQRPADVQVGRAQHPAAYRAEPRHRRPAAPDRHREQPPAVGLQHGARLEVGAGGHQVVARDGTATAAGSPTRWGAVRPARSPTLVISGRRGSKRRIGAWPRVGTESSAGDAARSWRPA